MSDEQFWPLLGMATLLGIPMALLAITALYRLAGWLVRRLPSGSLRAYPPRRRRPSSGGN